MSMKRQRKPKPSGKVSFAESAHNSSPHKFNFYESNALSLQAAGPGSKRLHGIVEGEGDEETDSEGGSNIATTSECRPCSPSSSSAASAAEDEGVSALVALLGVSDGGTQLYE